MLDPLSLQFALLHVLCTTPPGDLDASATASNLCRRILVTVKELSEEDKGEIFDLVNSRVKELQTSGDPQATNVLVHLNLLLTQIWGPEVLVHLDAEEYRVVVEEIPSEPAVYAFAQGHAPAEEGSDHRDWF